MGWGEIPRDPHPEEVAAASRAGRAPRAHSVADVTVDLRLQEDGDLEPGLWCPRCLLPSAVGRTFLVLSGPSGWKVTDQVLGTLRAELCSTPGCEWDYSRFGKAG